MSDLSSGGTDHEYCEICRVALGPKGLCTSGCPNDPHHEPGLIGTARGDEYSKFAAVYQKAVVDMRDRNLSSQKAVSSAEDLYEVTLSKGSRADLEWVVEEESEKFEKEEDHTLSFLHEYFDDQTVRSLSTGGEQS